jgi:hypothetical protein
MKKDLSAVMQELSDLQKRYMDDMVEASNRITGESDLENIKDFWKARGAISALAILSERLVG